MKLHLITTLSATSLILASVALSTPASAAVSQGEGASARSSASKVKADAKKYCMTVEAATGSRVSTYKCKTRTEWENMGFEVKGAK